MRGHRPTQWGCYRGNARLSGLGDTEELYGGADVSVVWRRGDFAFELVHGSSGADSGYSSDGHRSHNAVTTDTVFGVARGYVDKGGGGVFLGLCKRRLPRIRPSLLEQTDIASLRFDFLARRLELSRRSLIDRKDDAVRLLDLRSRGSPVANYAARVSRLFVNGAAIDTDRPVVAIIDTGTTGISVRHNCLHHMTLRRPGPLKNPGPLCHAA